MSEVHGVACPLQLAEGCGVLIQPYGGALSGGLGVPRPTVAGGVYAHLRIVHGWPDQGVRSLIREVGYAGS